MATARTSSRWWTEATRWTAAGVLGSAIFLVLFDSLAVAIALPAIGSELGIGPAGLQWVVTLYSLSIGGLLLLGGRVADMMGRRRVLVLALVLLTAGSLLAGLAPSLAILLVGRVMQGAAAAFALPASLAVTGGLFPEEPWRSRGFAIVALAGNTAALSGAIFGGLLTASFGWRWVFLVSVPPAVLATIAAFRVIPPDQNRPARTGPLDVYGAVFATVGLAALIYGAGRVADAGLLSIAALVPGFVGVALLAGFVRVQHRVTNPLVRPRILRSRRLLGSCAGIVANSAILTCIVVVGSLHLQDVHRLSPSETGLALAPTLIGTSVSSVVAPTLIRRFGARRVAAGGLAIGAVSLVFLGLGATSVSYAAAVLPWLLLRGSGGGVIYPALTREAIGKAAEKDRGATSGMFEATTHIGGAIAVAVYAVLLSSGLRYGGAYVAGAAFGFLGALGVLLVLPERRRDRRATIAQPSGPASQPTVR
jgi:MFS family permease